MYYNSNLFTNTQTFFFVEAATEQIRKEKKERKKEKKNILHEVLEWLIPAFE
jgi:hypothetical protein